MNDSWYVYTKVTYDNETEIKFPSRSAALKYFNDQIEADFEDEGYIVEISLSIESRLMFRDGRDIS